MENINALAVQIRDDGRAKGWNLIRPSDWLLEEDKIPSRLALIHSEISEAHDAMHGKDQDELAAEFADILIRVMDLAGAMSMDFQAHYDRLECSLLCADKELAFNALHQMTTYALEAFRSDELLKFLGALALLFFSVESFAYLRFDIDASVAVVEKMDVNRHRSYRHGGKRV